ncbi:glucose sorbosone dehydrogenase [Parvibaculum lavamentivorans DS-1]|uniref:Glucose sorbosone dehydrogenase n=1 Tax=Parvibaculum lavamentivorans (strain DS-1 / DSM 13023 / NCIMB 13966) TaxID=402881 RepID=A7HS98_PARL1|nr:PQQ-dependent sugar dehydrogenase [Parvibaculum lavamentivorans]ABS62781.1 glucose sorbosone dehydrogenase [Parvibaculum lavamentivorans DS-1]
MTNPARAMTTIAVTLLAALWAAGSAPVHAQEAAGSYEIVPIAEGLDHPWSLTFMPDGSILVVELSGNVRIIRGGVLSPDSVAGIPDVYFESQGGLFDLLLDPEFSTNGFVYLSYAHGTPGENRTRVARARFDGASLSDVEVIFDAEPAKNTPVHYGGRMLFLPDGTLLVTVGDGFDYREDAQRLDVDFGKVVRINRDGSVPEDNPFIGREGAKPEIWTLGHRNAQGIVYDNLSGRVYLHEHGPQGGDEINIIEPGKNYGWPVITYGLDYSGARISPYTEYEGMEQPLLHWTPSIAPAGFTLYRGSVFPEWDGDLFAGALAAKHLRRVDMENGQPVGQEELFGELGQRIREVRTGPDGYLYLVTDGENGSVLRVAPKE